MNKDCTVLISSCDKYSEAWTPFFYLFRKYWTNCPYEVVLCTESKDYNLYDVMTVNYDGNWAQRINYALKKIESKYVIFLLEDFFFQRDVNQEEVNRCIERMNNDLSIACFYFKRTTGYDENEIFFGKYILMAPHDEQNLYYLNCQSAIWRTDILREVCSRVKNPWEFEVEGYNRCKDLLKGLKLYCHEKSYYDILRDDDVFSYIVARKAGLGIYRSKVLWNTEKLLKEEGIPTKFKALRKMSRLECWIKEDITILIRRIEQYIKRKLFLRNANG